MARTLLVRGMVAGLLAGLAALAFAALFGEPQVAAAISVEEADAAGDHDHSPVSRLAQATFGLGLAVTVFGAAVGGVFGLAFGYAHGRLGRLSGRACALTVAALGFVATALVPFLKYPANPPGVESTRGMGERTALHFLVVLIAVAGVIGAVVAGRSLAARWGSWNATVAAGLAFAVLIAGAVALLPAVSSHSEGFPGELLWRFRVASLGTQAVLWTALGLVFGVLTERADRRGAPAARAFEPVA